MLFIFCWKFLLLRIFGFIVLPILTFINMSSDVLDYFLFSYVKQLLLD
jgi:hypothetical protein